LCCCTWVFPKKIPLNKLKAASDEVFVSDSIPSEVSLVKIKPIIEEQIQ